MWKLLIVSFVLLIGGLGASIAEQVLYGGQLDENNVLQESLFLPLSIGLIFIGFVLLSAAGGSLIWRYRYPKPEPDRQPGTRNDQPNP